jgi:hypothetical protein
MTTCLIILYCVIWTDATGRRRAWETTNECKALSEAAGRHGEIFRDAWQTIRAHHARSLGGATDVRTSPRHPRAR